MRLICPSCQSEYDVAAAAIGAKGRMVRCASCGGEWFQAPEDDVPAPLSLDEAQVGAEAAPQDFDVDVATESAAVDEVAEARGYRIIDETSTQSVTYDAAPEIERSFPAQDEYVPNSHSDASGTGALTASLRDDDDDDIHPATSGGAASFVGGFATSAVLVGLFAAVYVAAPSIIDAIPALEPAMDGYVGVVDKGRTVLSVLVGS